MGGLARVGDGTCSAFVYITRRGKGQGRPETEVTLSFGLEEADRELDRQCFFGLSEVPGGVLLGLGCPPLSFSSAVFLLFCDFHCF